MSSQEPHPIFFSVHTVAYPTVVANTALGKRDSRSLTAFKLSQREFPKRKSQKSQPITANQHGATPSAARACRSVLGRSPHEGQMPPSRPASIHSGPGHPNGRVCGLTCIPGARPMPLLVLCGWSDVRSEAANPPYKIPGL